MAVALSAGCSDEASSAATAGASAPGAFPVTVEHAFGSTVVPADPQRVVTVGLTEHDTVLALGIVPVGVTEWYGDRPSATWPWAHEALGGAEPTVLSATDGFEFEKIASLRPDLIVGTNAGMTRADYDTLSVIAPTIAHADGYESAYFQPWDVQALAVGRALGREAEITRIVGDVKARFREAADDHPEFAGTSIAFLQNAFYDGNAIAYQEGLSTAFLTDLGFTIPSALAAFSKDGGQAYIPVERLPVLDAADVLLWATESPADRTKLEENALYRRLDAVKEGRLVFTDATTAGAIYFTSVLSLPYVLDRLVPALASTMAGEGPATTW